MLTRPVVNVGVCSSGIALQCRISGIRSHVFGNARCCLPVPLGRRRGGPLLGSWSVGIGLLMLLAVMITANATYARHPMAGPIIGDTFMPRRCGLV